MSLVELDDLDRHILDLLGEDARLSNRSIARRLGLVEGTIRARIKRLQQRRLLRFTAITDNRQHGRPTLAFIGIRNDTRRTRELAATIAGIEQVRSVIITLGRFNLLAVGLFPTLESLIELANNRILVLPGVTQVETSVVVKSIKYNERMAKIGFGEDNGSSIDGDADPEPDGEDDEDEDQSVD